MLEQIDNHFDKCLVMMTFACMFVEADVNDSILSIQTAHWQSWF